MTSAVKTLGYSNANKSGRGLAALQDLAESGRALNSARASWSAASPLPLLFSCLLMSLLTATINQQGGKAKPQAGETGRLRDNFDRAWPARIET